MNEDDVPFVPDPTRCQPCYAPLDRSREFFSNATAECCFACNYTTETLPSVLQYNALEKADLDTSYKGLESVMALMDAGTVSTQAVVSLVHSFYEREIRHHNPELPAWSPSTIYEHLVFHRQSDAGQMSDMVQLLQAQVHSLKRVAWECPAPFAAGENDSNDAGTEPPCEPQPNLRVLAMMNSLAKTTMEGIRLRRLLAQSS